MSVEGGPDIVTDGLVLHLDAANNRSYPGTGTTWTDLTSNKFTGSFVNGPTFNSGNAGGIVFDGTNDYIEIPNNAAINPTSAVTLCSFFRINGFGSNIGPIIFKKNTRSAQFEQYSLGVGTNSIYTIMSNSGGTQIVRTIPYTYGTLTFVTAIFNPAGGNMSLYRNGILADSVSISISFDVSTEPLRIGGIPVIYTGYANGTIYTAQIYNRALSAKEIRQNYHATKGRYGLF